MASSIVPGWIWARNWNLFDSVLAAEPLCENVDHYEKAEIRISPGRGWWMRETRNTWATPAPYDDLLFLYLPDIEPGQRIRYKSLVIKTKDRHCQVREAAKLNCSPACN